MDELYPKEIELTPESRIIDPFLAAPRRRKAAQPEGGCQSPHGRRPRLRHRRVPAGPERAGRLRLRLEGPRRAVRFRRRPQHGRFRSHRHRADLRHALHVRRRAPSTRPRSARSRAPSSCAPAPCRTPKASPPPACCRKCCPPPRAERAAAMLTRLLALENRSPAAGDFNFMDVRRHWLPDEQRWGLRNYWMGANEDLPGALWLLYLQTGRPDIFIAARRNLRHVLGMDMCNDSSPALAALADPRRRKIAGAFGDCRTPVHWQSACCVSDRHARLLGLLLAYYLTGDLVARDAALLWAEAAKNYGPATGGADGLAYLDNLSELLSLELRSRAGRARAAIAPITCSACPWTSRRPSSGFRDCAPTCAPPATRAPTPTSSASAPALKAAPPHGPPLARPAARPARGHRRSGLHRDQAAEAHRETSRNSVDSSPARRRRTRRSPGTISAPTSSARPNRSRTSNFRHVRDRSAVRNPPDRLLESP